MYKRLILGEDSYEEEGITGLCEEGEGEGENGNGGVGENGEGDSPTPEYLTKEQAGSWFGRVASKQLEDKILPMMQEMSDRIEGMSAPKQQPVQLNKMDEELTEMILAGRTTEALERYESVKRQAKADITTKKTNEVNKLMVAYKDDNIYDNIQTDMDKIAKEKVSEGWPPQAAVIHAREVAEKNMLHGKLYGDEHSGLEMTSGGRPIPKAKKAQLPAIYKSACERDIADGIVEDEKEFISMLSPKIRELYGL